MLDSSSVAPEGSAQSLTAKTHFPAGAGAGASQAR